MEDLSYGEAKEDDVKSILENLGYTVEKTSKTSLTDFYIEKGKTKYHVELKSRKCERTKYPDTMIGANKLGEAWNLFYKEGIETLFLFKFTDGLYMYNPLKVFRTEFKAGRWGRGVNADGTPVDKPKGWLYIESEKLITITK